MHAVTPASRNEWVRRGPGALNRTKRMASYSRIAALLTTISCCAAQLGFITSVFPASVPSASAPQMVQVLAQGRPPRGNVTLPFLLNGTAVRVPATCTVAPACIVSLPSVGPGGVAQLGNVALTVFTPPIFNPPTVQSLSTTGFVLLQFGLTAQSAPFPVPAPQMLLQCRATAPLPGDVWQRTSILNSDGSVTFVTTETALTAANNSAAGMRYEVSAHANVAQLSDNTSVLQFYSKPVPEECGLLSVWVSYNGGAHLHAVATFPVTRAAPLKIVSLYPYNISASPWVATHNAARISITSSLQGAVDAVSFFTQSWRLPALPTGTPVDAQFFNTSINVLKASLILCAGTQYLSTAVSMAAMHPNVSILIMSTVMQAVPARPNLAFATGRMYEAMYVAGIVAGATTRSGRLGFIMSLSHPTVYSFVNAFFLGAQAALAAGLARPGVTNLRLFTHIIGAFSDDYAERYAAIDLLTRADASVDILCSVTDNPSPHRECHARGCYSIGFNGDLRQSLGDSVLISTTYLLQDIYEAAVMRMLNGQAIGPDAYTSGMGRGVDITTTVSPIVSLAAQRTVQAVAAGMREADDTLEKVFCTTSTLVDNNGTVRLRAASNSRSCLGSSEIGAMTWMLAGVELYGVFTPPPLPAPLVPVAWSLPIDLQAGALFLSGFTLLLVVLSSVMVLVRREAAVVRFASPAFLLIANAGAAGMSADVFWTVFQPVPTDSSCTGTVWLSGISFVLLFGALFAKTYRMDRIFNNVQLRRLNITALHVLRILVLVMFAEVGLLLLATFAFPRAATLITVYGNSSDGSINSITTFTTCAARSAIGVDGATVVYVGHLLLLFWGAVLGFRTRNLPHAFNESRYIGLAIYNVTVCDLLAFLIASPYASDPRTPHHVTILRFGIPPLVTMLLLYVPKAWALLHSIQDSSGETRSSTDESGGDGSGISGASNGAQHAGQNGCAYVLLACLSRVRAFAHWWDALPAVHKVAPERRGHAAGESRKKLPRGSEGSQYRSSDGMASEADVSMFHGSSSASVLSGRMNGLSLLSYGSGQSRSHAQLRVQHSKPGPVPLLVDEPAVVRSTLSQDMSVSSSVGQGSLILAREPGAEVVVTVAEQPAGGVGCTGLAPVDSGSLVELTASRDSPSRRSAGPGVKHEIVVSPPLEPVAEVAEHSEV